MGEAIDDADIFDALQSRGRGDWRRAGDACSSLRGAEVDAGEGRDVSGPVDVEEVL